MDFREADWRVGIGMAWLVEEHDMMAGQAHGRDLQQSLGMGERCVDERGGEGSGHAGSDLSPARERCATAC